MEICANAIVELEVTRRTLGFEWTANELHPANEGPWIYEVMES